MGKFIDLTGKQFGKLTVIERDYNYANEHNLKNNVVYWKCQCVCGKIKAVRTGDLNNGKVKSCGRCFLADDLTGQHFGKLTVLERDFNYRTKNGIKGAGAFWKCSCECGGRVTTSAKSLKNGTIISCGCVPKAMITKLGKNTLKDLTGKKFGKLTVIKRNLSYATENNIVSKHPYWDCVCDCGGKITVLGTSLTQGLTSSCGCISSLGEEKIKNILIDNNIKFEVQKKFPDLRINNTWFYRYGFYLPDYNRLIEFDGEQHYSYSNKGWNTEEQFKKTQYSDQVKNEYALSNHIDLIRIPYWERDNITLEMLLKDKYLIKGVNNEE